MRKFLMMAAALFAFAATVQAEGDKEADIRNALRGLNAMVPIVEVKPAAFPGLYQVTLKSGETLYTNESGSHFVVGDMFKVSENGALVNLTEEAKKGDRLELLASNDASDTINFAAEGEKKASVTVFTDVDCFYCRKLHKEIADINALGIEVRYLAFPRAGAGSPAHLTMDSVWCADDEETRKELMTKAKQGDSLPQANSSCESPVLSQMNVGRKAGVTGTPALVLEDGTLVPGYVPAARLAEMLQVN
ncbi:DsbC family protein [Aliamphritea spongicola]|uniref:DsbC family protein n=1 Tax=Aliamphritea spongicola TaxID=707589 RepID=UPI00196BA81D|nr:DsbC family protein [Aliamphritea spongicola]MBN3564018.1 DsbC family protein [Aliamphritea spongicola]